MYGIYFHYRNIKPEATGRLLKYKIKNAGFTVSDIQKYLNLSCPQPIYRWFKGTIMPSVNHLYALSRLLGVHMDELIISLKFDYCDVDDVDFKSQNERITVYGDYLLSKKETVALSNVLTPKS